MSSGGGCQFGGELETGYIDHTDSSNEENDIDEETMYGAATPFSTPHLSISERAQSSV